MKIRRIISYSIVLLLVLIINIHLITINNSNNITIANVDKISEPVVDKKISINNEVIENQVLNKYVEFNSIIYNNRFSLPLDNKRIPQGITLVDNYIFVTGYYENNNKSDVYIMDLEGKVLNNVILDTNSHVGSIAYDSINNLVWIPGNNGKLLAYNKDDFFNSNNVKNVLNIDYVKDGLYDYIDTNKYNIAFLTIDNEYIYLGSFNQHKKCIVKKYIIKNEDGIKLEYINEFKLPSRVQGLSIYHDNNKTYLITSNSYNRYEKSKLKIYEYDETIKDYGNMSIKRYVIPPMSEQISIKNGYGFIIFESGASKYNDAKDKVKNIIIIEMKKVLE